MAVSVQGWKKKLFCIKDKKSSPSDLFGIAPFDAAKNLEKLASWDSPPIEPEVEDVKPLLARIQALKSDDGGALTGTQLTSFFLQCRVQPLQHRPSKLWSFSGLGDSSQVSDDLFEKKDLDKRVRALTILTKEDDIPDLTASYFDAQHPLPTVCYTIFYSSCFSLIIICLVILGLFSFQDHRLLVSRPPLLEAGAIQMSLFLRPPKPQRLGIAKMGTKAKIRWKGPAQRCHLLLRFWKILLLTRKGSASKISLPRLPLLIKPWPGRLPRQRMI
jgi:hypothetical protein